MNKLDALIKALQDDDKVKRFQELETIINNDASLQKEYQRLLKAQKVLVNYEHHKDPKLKKAQAQYTNILEELGNHPLFNEFIDLLEWINDDLVLLQKIFESAINEK
ncbi:MAG: YlbF family regulator [Candidatus Izemoplasma sp.]|nr:YlbF family regulator [Candidatus Izemoplasma sp.]